MRLVHRVTVLAGCSLLWAGAASANPQDTVDRIAQGIESLRTQLGEFVARPEVAAALADSAESRRDAETALTAEFQASVPEVRRLRILTESEFQVDYSSEPPLTYAALAMLEQALQDGAVPDVEVHLSGQPQAHIVVVAPLGKSAGLHLAVDPGYVDKLVQPEGGTAVQLTQAIKGARLTSLVSRGEFAAGGQAEFFPVPGTAWKLKMGRAGRGTGTAGGEAAPESPLPLILAGAAALVVVLGIYVLFRLGKLKLPKPKAKPAGRKAAQNVDYQGAIQAIREGAYPGLERLVPGLAMADGGQVPAMVSNFDDEPDTDDAPTRLAASPGAEVDFEFPDADEDVTVPASAGAAEGEKIKTSVPAVIFRTYDIRGIVGESLTVDGVRLIARALGAEADARDQSTLVVGRDGRNSSPELGEALIEGLLASGRQVIDIGLVPTPVLYFATHFLDTGSGVMLTGSHNPGNYNGMKIMLAGDTLSGDDIQAIRRRVKQKDFVEGTGERKSAEVIPEYIRRISEDIPVALGNAFKLVVDCGNGVPGVVAPQLLRALGHDVVELYCEVDGDFPNHHPDPSQLKNLEDLIEMVRMENADMGLAFDGDGDRLGIVDRNGVVIWPDRQMMLFAKDVLSRNAGAEIIYDVKCTGHLARVIEENGGKPVMWKTGHSLIKSRMRESGAPLAGEMSGHIFFKDRWYGFDDAIYSAARLTEILLADSRPPEEVFAELPGGVATPELRIDLPEDRHQAFMQELVSKADFSDGTVATVDGLRVDLDNAWGLVRPSNTTPCIVCRFEGDDEAALQAIQDRFRSLVTAVDDSLTLPF